jgi:hypothetical protein
MFQLSAPKRSGRDRKAVRQREITFQNVDNGVINVILSELKRQKTPMVDVELSASQDNIRLFVYADDVLGVLFCWQTAESLVRNAIRGTSIALVTPR